jgi:flagellar protein FlgJ
MDKANLFQQPVNHDLMQAHQNYTDIKSLNNLKQQAREDQRAALKPVAEQFEALFLEQIFKEARKIKLDDGWLDGNQGDFYKDWHDKQLAQDLAAKGSLGFADNIVEQLLPSIPGLNANNITTKAAVTDGDKKVVNTPSTEQALLSRPINSK